MWISVQTQATEKIGYQDQKHQFAGLSNMLGARSASVTVRDVSGL
jgi:hypothetical protein